MYTIDAKRAAVLLSAVMMVTACESGPGPLAVSDPPPPSRATAPARPVYPQPTGKPGCPYTIRFSGFTWCVRDELATLPGPSTWSWSNVYVDAAGRLHLKLSEAADRWNSSEVWTQATYLFGRFRVVVVDLPAESTLPDDVTFGFFTYVPGTPSYTGEIDVELYHRSGAGYTLSYVTWPDIPRIARDHKETPWACGWRPATHEISWRSTSVLFSSTSSRCGSMSYSFPPPSRMPPTPVQRIPQRASAIHLNFWKPSAASIPNRTRRVYEVVVESVTRQ